MSLFIPRALPWLSVLTKRQARVDPLRYIYVPLEDSQGFFRTSDRTRYHRDPATGVIRRLVPKVRGKAARRAEKRARREARATAIARAA